MNSPRLIIIVLAVIFSSPNYLGATMEVDHQGEKITLGGRVCLKCHDDMEKHSHPVLIKYPPEGRENDFASADNLLNHGIILINDQLVCITCHDLKNNTPKHLVMENAQSKLCTSCHLK